MVLISRRRHEPAAEPEEASPGIWQPVTGEVAEVPPREMDDDGCAGRAFGVYYQLDDDSAPAAIITVWTYPGYCHPDEGGFILGRKFEYAVYRDGTGPWLRADWMCATEDTTVYRDLAGAERAAREAAHVLAKSAFQSASDGGSLTGFEWDGAPW